MRMPLLAAFVAALSVMSAPVCAQGAQADYDRAEMLRTRFFGLVEGIADEPVFSADSRTLVYRRTMTGGGYQFVQVDIPTLTRGQGFDQVALARTLARMLQRPYGGLNLPFAKYALSADRAAMEFEASNARWRCKFADYSCVKLETINRPPPPEGMGDRNPIGSGPPEKPESSPVKSPDGSLEAYIENFNLFVRAPGAGDGRQLSFDGAESAYYVVTANSWSPDSKMLALSRTHPGEEHFIHHIDSSPESQKQPLLTEMYYIKPGDTLTDRQPVLFDLASGRATVIDRKLFPNAYLQSEPQWWKDGRGFYIRYNQRGHQAYRLIEVNRQGVARVLIDEQAKTYIEYSSKIVFEPVDDGKEIVWMSERDGWCHLYLYDGLKGLVKKQITKGGWAVRALVDVDPVKRQIVFSANGMRAGEDPYFVHYYRINFDGTGLTPLSDGQGTHALTFSPDKSVYLDIWSRVDMAPFAQLRRSSDAKILLELERPSLDALVAAGWSSPEPFIAKGRDGVTDIYGLIVKPINFDPTKRYPVIESIYAGPQGAFVPKSFAAYRPLQAQAELGFIVVEIDGMGTNYRSKAFHDVSWKNLADAGFPDRIRWHRALAEKYPWYDITRVGIYGASAGGQNAMAALLFYPRFYDVAVAYAGSHDNRMDKIWWNEQYMGWPIGPQYSASSNVDNAWRLKGKLMLVVGELDTNVDPSSTFQVVDALVKAGKTFDFLFLPGQGHNEGGSYGERRRWDFFVNNLMSVDPPNRNVPNFPVAPLTTPGAPSVPVAASTQTSQN